MKAKCHKALQLLRVVAHTDWGADKSTLLKLYQSLVRSKLDYGCFIYGSARKSYLRCLDSIHHLGLRLALGALRTSPVESLYVEANEAPLSLMREKLALQYYTKLQSCPSNPAFDCTINPKYQECFARKESAIPTFGIRIQSLLENSNIPITMSMRPSYRKFLPGLYIVQRSIYVYQIYPSRKHHIIYIFKNSMKLKTSTPTVSTECFLTFHPRLIRRYTRYHHCLPENTRQWA